jgi:hypothetical protein
MELEAFTNKTAHKSHFILESKIQRTEVYSTSKTNTLSAPTMNFFHKLATLVGFSFLLPVLVVSIVMSSDAIEQSSHSTNQQEYSNNIDILSSD